MANTTTAAEVQYYAEQALEDARILSGLIEGERLPDDSAEHYGVDTDADWLDLLDVMALEVYGNATVRSTTAPELMGVTVVTGTGGPHTEFYVDTHDRVVGIAIWGSDRAEKFDTLPGLFDALAEIVGQA